MGRRRSAAAAGLAAAVLLVAPASALAGLDIAVQPNEARFGDAHHATGRMTDAAGAALAGRRVALQERDYPFTGAFHTIGHTTTRADGGFSFAGIRLSRNADLRVEAFDGTTSGIARAFTYPAFALTYRPAGDDKIKVTQTYRTPRDVRLTAPTLFYLGRGSAKVSTKRVRARTRRAGKGRFVATKTIELPKSWRGRFKYASCFGYTKNSGMGDPARGCAKTFRF
jgi:hypothetical protein